MKKLITQELLDNLKNHDFVLGWVNPDQWYINNPGHKRYIMEIRDGESLLSIYVNSCRWSFNCPYDDDETGHHVTEMGCYPEVSLKEAREFYKDFLKNRIKEVSELLAYEESKNEH